MADWITFMQLWHCKDRPDLLVSFNALLKGFQFTCILTLNLISFELNFTYMFGVFFQFEFNFVTFFSFEKLNLFITFFIFFFNFCFPVIKPQIEKFLGPKLFQFIPCNPLEIPCCVLTASTVIAGKWDSQEGFPNWLPSKC